MKKSEIYQQAKYYEIAFDFVDVKKQISLFEKFIKEYSKIKVDTVLDICCGTALQLREFSKRGYKSIGLDSSKDMLSYLEKISGVEKISIRTVKANMIDFKLDRSVDFAYILMGSIIYVKNNDEFMKHLSSVANSLKTGGLYLIENLAINWTDKDFWQPQVWDMESDGIKVNTTYQIKPKDLIEETVTQTIKFKVSDHGKEIEFVDKDELKLIFPQELKALVDLQGQFEFIGFFERESTNKLENDFANNIVLLRKK